MAEFEEVANYLDDKLGSEIKFGIGIDGSRATEKALEIAAYFLKEEKENQEKTLTMLHMKDGKRTPLPHLTPEHLQHNARLKLEGCIEKKNFTWTETIIEEDKTICDQLESVCEEKQLDFIIVGSTGVSEKGLNVLGSVAEHCLRGLTASVIITRPSACPLPDKKVFLLCVDGSPASMLAAVNLVHLTTTDDIIHVIHCTPFMTDETKTVLEPYEAFFAKSKRSCKPHYVEMMPGLTMATMIIDYAKLVETDFLVMGISGYGNQKLGSVSTRVCKEARCTTIVVKDKRLFKA